MSMTSIYFTYDGLLHGPTGEDPLPDALVKTIRTYQTSLGTVIHEQIAGEGSYSERFRVLRDDVEEVMYLGRERVSPLLEDALTFMFEACEVLSE